jgi:hypothetical protein
MKHFSYKNIFIAGIIILIAACSKETSHELRGNIYGSSSGTLKDSLGNCQGIIVNGIYKADSVLTDSNYIVVKVNVTGSGQYKIFSDTANGFWFRDSGYITAGLQNIKVRGYGKPILPLNTDFVVSYNNSICIFTVNLVTPPVPLPIFRDYFPTTIGSNWAYDLAGVTDTLHVDASPKDSVISGTTYRVFYGVRGTVKDTSLYSKTGNDYYRYTSLDFNSINMPLLFLKDNQPVVTQWESSIANTMYNGIPTQVKMRYTLLAVNVARTVNGNVFDSVIQVQNDLQYKVVGTFQTAQTFNTYYAKNVGLIEFSIPGSYSQTIRRWKVY